MSALRSAADSVTHTVTDVVDEMMQRVPEVIHRVPDVLPGHHRSRRMPTKSVTTLVLVVLAVVAWRLWTRRQSTELGDAAGPEWSPTDVNARVAAG